MLVSAMQIYQSLVFVFFFATILFVSAEHTDTFNICSTCFCATTASGKSKIDCNNKALDVFPAVSTYPGDAEELFYQNNLFTYVTSNSFYGLYNVRKISLANNRIKSLDADAFAKQRPVLYDLDLYANRLTSLPQGLLADTSSLKYLYLHGNSINAIPSDLLSDSTSLNTLYLNDNTLVVLPENLLASARDLEVLYIHNNKLTGLPDGLFANTKSLKKLKLYGNNFLCCDLGYQNLQFLAQHTDILQSIGGTTPASTQQLIKCAYAAETTGVDRSVISLLQGHSTLCGETQEAACTQCSCDTGGQTVQCAGKPFTEPPSFPSTSVNVDLSNGLLKQITSGSFSGLNELKTLTLNYNQIVSIELSNLPKLESISMKNNSLTSISTSTFSGLPLLKTVDFSHNQIGSNVVFPDVPSLVTLKLAYNNIQVFNSALSASRRRRATANVLIEDLDLSNNGIVYFGNNTLDSWAHLKYLDISNNKLTSLLEVDFSKLSQLTTLKLYGNPFDCCLVGKSNILHFSMKNYLQDAQGQVTTAFQCSTTSNGSTVSYADLGSLASDYDSLCSSVSSNVDCLVSEWSNWGLCTASNITSKCGDGTSERFRVVLVYPQNGGTTCPKLREEQKCTVSCNDETTTKSDDGGDSDNIMLIMAVGVAIGITVVLVSCGVAMVLRRRRKRKEKSSIGQDVDEFFARKGSLKHHSQSSDPETASVLSGYADFSTTSRGGQGHEQMEQSRVAARTNTSGTTVSSCYYLPKPSNYHPDCTDSGGQYAETPSQGYMTPYFLPRIYENCNSPQHVRNGASDTNQNFDPSSAKEEGKDSVKLQTISRALQALDSNYLGTENTTPADYSSGDCLCDYENSPRSSIPKVSNNGYVDMEQGGALKGLSGDTSTTRKEDASLAQTKKVENSKQMPQDDNGKRPLLQDSCDNSQECSSTRQTPNLERATSQDEVYDDPIVLTRGVL
eukprot:Nk52_evm3s2171 gene=Nk52_evmTU3s2171